MKVYRSHSIFSSLQMRKMSKKKITHLNSLLNVNKIISIEQMKLTALHCTLLWTKIDLI